MQIKQKQHIISLYESWLCTGNLKAVNFINFLIQEETPLVKDDDTMAKSLADPYNLDVLFTFIFNPEYFPLSQNVNSRKISFQHHFYFTF